MTDADFTPLPTWENASHCQDLWIVSARRSGGT